MGAVNFSYYKRSKEPEYMDEANLSGQEMRAVLNDLRTVNKYLGGTRITLKGIERLLKSRNKEVVYTLVDLGCGDGEMLRQCAIFAKKNNFKFKLIGIDFNPNIIEYAISKSKEYENISFQAIDLFSDNFTQLNADICLCTLFLHHFEDSKIINFVYTLYEQSKIGVVVNDLHRNPIAFYTFKWLSEIILKTKIARHDGLVSVARSFRKQDLFKFSKQIKAENQSIEWKWAFRYQWILNK